jgi:hypothetical protein
MEFLVAVLTVPAGKMAGGTCAHMKEAARKNRLFEVTFLATVGRHAGLPRPIEGLVAVVRDAIGLPAVFTPVDVRSAQAHRSIDGRRSDGRLVGDSAAEDCPCNEGCRREPPSIVLPIATTVLPISTVSIVVTPVAAVLETRTLDPALLTRPLEAVPLHPASVIATTKLHLLQVIARRTRLHER